MVCQETPGPGFQGFHLCEGGLCLVPCPSWEPFTRESIIKDGESKSLFYRPEKYDVLVYSPENGEIRMNARSKGEKELYRTKFGLHLFDDSEFSTAKASSRWSR